MVKRRPEAQNVQNFFSSLRTFSFPDIGRIRPRSMKLATCTYFHFWYGPTWGASPADKKPLCWHHFRLTFSKCVMVTQIKQNRKSIKSLILFWILNWQLRPYISYFIHRKNILMHIMSWQWWGVRKKIKSLYLRK